MCLYCLNCLIWARRPATSLLIVDICATGKELVASFTNVFNIHTLSIVNFNQMSTNVDRCHLFRDLKLYDRPPVLHLNENVKRNSIADGCYSKIERSIILRNGQSGKGEPRNTGMLPDYALCFMPQLNDLRDLIFKFGLLQRLLLKVKSTQLIKDKSNRITKQKSWTFLTECTTCIVFEINNDPIHQNNIPIYLEIFNDTFFVCKDL